MQTKMATLLMLMQNRGTLQRYKIMCWIAGATVSISCNCHCIIDIALKRMVII